MPVTNKPRLHTRRSRPQNGFTLVELMVVIFIAGLMAGMVMLSLPGDERSLANDAEKFAARLAAARDVAIVRSRSMAVSIGPSGYGFEQREGGAWLKIADRSFASQSWTPGTVPMLAGRAREARIAFDSTGLPSAPVDLTLAREDRRMTVHLSGSGEVRIAAH